MSDDSVPGQSNPGESQSLLQPTMTNLNKTPAEIDSIFTSFAKVEANLTTIITNEHTEIRDGLKKLDGKLDKIENEIYSLSDSVSALLVLQRESLYDTLHKTLKMGM